MPVDEEMENSWNASWSIWREAHSQARAARRTVTRKLLDARSSGGKGPTPAEIAEAERLETLEDEKAEDVVVLAKSVFQAS